jgi:arabinose-5-phosphate isomerase
VIRAEIDGLQLLATALNGSLGAALDLVAAATGRLIVTGIGKSGHIARKIAATLASTGTRAQFVHPAEASHGDLGMIAADDVVLALSNSGNSAELGDILAYSRRFGIPLIDPCRGRRCGDLATGRGRGLLDGTDPDDLDHNDAGAR